MNKRDEKIVNNLGLVNKVINDKIIYNNNNYDDLYQIGCVGLIKAVDTFDETKNIKFSTYAYKLIYTEILSYLKLSQNNKKALSLDTTTIKYCNDIKEDANLINFIKDEKCSIEDDYIKEEERIIINKILKKARLSDKNKFIILLYYGFYNDKKYTRKELANIFNVSPTYIAVIINKSLKEIKRLVTIEYGKDIKTKKFK